MPHPIPVQASIPTNIITTAYSAHTACCNYSVIQDTNYRSQQDIEYTGTSSDGDNYYHNAQ